jgi:5-methylcytosine-specific restriction endonuclease McrA
LVRNPDATLEEITARNKYAEASRVHQQAVSSYESESATLHSQVSERKKLWREITILRTLIREHRKRETAAKVAAFHDNLRGTAPAVRRALSAERNRTARCPYCGLVTDKDDLVADHIYPVALGGLSTIQNMVWICETCNKAKRRSTLRGYCQKGKFDFEGVCRTLEALGKQI